MRTTGLARRRDARSVQGSGVVRGGGGVGGGVHRGGGAWHCKVYPAQGKQKNEQKIFHVYENPENLICSSCTFPDSKD